jgi:ABC-2 type transport system permease protein
MYFPTMLAIAVTGVLLPGNNAPLGLGLIAANVAFLVIWGNLLSLGVVGVMRARRIREIAGVVGLTLLIGLAFVPAMLDTDGLDIKISRDAPLVRTAVSAAEFLPPSIAARGLTALYRPDGTSVAALGLLWLLLWDVAGLVLGYLIFDRYHLGETGVKIGGRVKRAEARKAPDGRWLTLDGPLFSRLPSEVRAVTGKDLHYLFRSVIGRVNLFTAPLFTLLVALFAGRGFDTVILGLDPRRLVLYGMLLYGTMFSSNFFNNTLAWESDGIQSYYLGPASPRRVFLGKNLALWLYNLILLVSILATWTIVSGPPDPATLATGILIFATGLLILTTTGNLLSVIFPVPRDVSAMKNNPSGVAVLFSLLVLLVTALTLGSLVGLPMLLGWRFVQPVLLLALLGGMVFVYKSTLGTTARLFEERRESIIHTFKTAR